jgi:hypothetical protein
MVRTLLRAFRPRTRAAGRRAFVPAVESLEMRWTPSVTFAAQRTFASGSATLEVAVGDFNGDGRPDLAVADQFDNNVSVRLNTTPAGAATASFDAQRTFAAGYEPASVAVGDFNGDGRPDLAVANQGSSTVSVLLNTTAAGSGTASFAAQHTFAAGVGPYGLAVGDFNGDGRPDLAVANHNGNTVSVLLNTTVAGAATASFAAQRTFAAGSKPAGVRVGDFNGDGRPDLAVANYNGNTVSVLLNTTSAGSSPASFAAQNTFATGSGPFSVGVGDFNGDGRPDLAVVNTSVNSVSVLLNTAAAGAITASFAAQKSFATGSGPVSVAVGDFDGDGRPDLAVGNVNVNSVSVLLNTAAAGAITASFAAQKTFAAGSGSGFVAVGDFNRDGRPDLAVSNSGDNTLSVLLNTTTPFANAAPTVVGQFGSVGVWEFNRSLSSWSQLTAANATLLAADPQGDVVGAFPGYGVWEYKPVTGWKQINGVDATALAMDARGEIAAEFPGFGVGEFLPSAGWRLLTGANASVLAMDALGDVAGVFPGYGIWEFRPAVGWKQLNGVDASLLAMDALGDVVANFHGFGVGEYRPASGWSLLNGVEAQSLAIDAAGDVAAQFSGYGVGEYLPASGWRTLTLANATQVAMGGNGDVFGAFAGSGVWEFDPSFGWIHRPSTDAAVLVMA